MDELLADHAVSHAGLRRVRHPGLGVTVVGETAVRYLRFFRPVRLSRLELPPAVCSRWVPEVPAHPAHLTVSVLDPATSRWRTVRDVRWPPDPRIRGDGLRQDLPGEAIDAHFRAVLDGPPKVIELGGLVTDHLRVECDAEHPVWPNHGECYGAPHTVPFGILNPLKAFGDGEGQPVPVQPYRPILRRGTVRPAAPRGLAVDDRPDMVLYHNRRLAVGFSLQRPVLLHLGWDALGQGQSHRNRLAASRRFRSAAGGVLLCSGPLFRSLWADRHATAWTGSVSVDGNRVIYRDLQAIDGLVVDAAFTVEPTGLVIELTQRCERDLPVLEAEAWRLAFDLTAGITGAAALPTLRPGRNGEVELPLTWATDGVGCLAMRRLDGEPEQARVQIESYRQVGCVTGGLVLAPRPELGYGDRLPAGTRSAVFELRLTNLEPRRRPGAGRAGDAVRRHWATTFACFRPELRGFSNHSASINCHLSQGAPMEIVAHTRPSRQAPDPLALARFTIERALLDGGGYGYWRNLYLDSDPVLVSAAGRLHQARSSLTWLRRIEPGLRAAVGRMAEHLDDHGLVRCRDLSGDSYSYRWSSNAMDVVGFGHWDAYVNAWSYRAFRTAAALLAALGDETAAELNRARAAGLRAAYGRELVNPATGWVAGWRSRDGQLHDYAFIWVNGVALAFGLLDPEPARRALTGLERLRDEVGPGHARLGLPCNLLPIAEYDQMLPRRRGGLEPTFETYTDGSLSGWPATYYLRALAIHGLTDRARTLADELAAGYAAGMFNGGHGQGQEFRSWENFATGYEGTLIGCFGPLYGIAIEQGLLQPTEPEWWPEGG